MRVYQGKKCVCQLNTLVDLTFLVDPALPHLDGVAMPSATKPTNTSCFLCFAAKDRAACLFCFFLSK